ncbi:MAG: hypothetical protein QT08_C0019G0026 [archaeon GW2011_AR17]|nr:MAG: hypothetical protein QT08_C0019G0026 [archaeon GW2011_AR17]MBS3154728.1 hypothetical protein [Candidatus Woesearchaeota archaeon]HIH15759.1 hypothetical protein [Nanoarchaeota archaeon]HIH58429.1 hypothetical protein [Nanoarchaeota archaeon]HII13721.1 hypothetical protein [Nanoarchaeota archaeon]
MVLEIYRIRVNSSEENKDNAFRILMNSGLSIICLEDEKYLVPKDGMALLRKENVIYESI